MGKEGTLASGPGVCRSPDWSGEGRILGVGDGEHIWWGAGGGFWGSDRAWAGGSRAGAKNDQRGRLEKLLILARGRRGLTK